MEMKKVRIHVKSYEKNNNEKAAIETVSFGRMAEKNGKFYVFYDETEAVYKTPYITFGLKTNTEYLYVCCRDGIWNIELEYMLEIAGQEQSEMKIKITIEEDAHGH